METYRETRSLRDEKREEERRKERQRQARRQRQVKRLVRWAVAFAILAAMVVVTWAAMGPVRLSPMADAWAVMGRRGDSFPLDFSYGHTRQAALLGQSIALLGPTHLGVYTRGGYESLGLEQPYASPSLYAAGRRTVLFDRASGKLMLLSRMAKLYDIELDRDIYCVGLNRRGDLAAATKSDSGASEVYVWDAKEKQRFAWRCEKEYPSALCLAENGRSLAACLIGTEKAGVYARFVDYPLGDETPRTDLRLDGAWLYGAAPASGGWLAVGDRAVYRIKHGAKAPETFSYEGRALECFDAQPGGYCAVLLEDWDNHALLRVYDSNGKLVLEQRFRSRPLEVACRGKSVYLRFDTHLLRWQKSSGFRQSQALPLGTQGVCVAGRDAYVLTVRDVQLMRVHWEAPQTLPQ